VTLLFIPSQLDEPCRVGVRRGDPPMRDINNVGGKVLFFYDGRTERSFGTFSYFQNTLRKLIGSESFKPFASTICFKTSLILVGSPEEGRILFVSLPQ